MDLHIQRIREKLDLKNNIKTYLIKGPYLIHNKNSTHQFDQIEMSEVISTIKSEIIKRSGK